jgi:3,5-dihydroxyphenylacetyl-CoA synthase
VIGFNVRKPLERLLARNGLDFSAIKHWLLHTGGGAVIDSVKLGIGLNEHDVRHTRSVLRDYGNISSGSFLVSLERLLAESCVSAGDRGVMVTMGPGAQIETALLQFGQAGENHDG